MLCSCPKLEYVGEPGILDCLIVLIAHIKHIPALIPPVPSATVGSAEVAGYISSTAHSPGSISVHGLPCLWTGRLSVSHLCSDNLAIDL
jgi:hypothetical protein